MAERGFRSVGSSLGITDQNNRFQKRGDLMISSSGLYLFQTLKKDRVYA